MDSFSPAGVDSLLSTCAHIEYDIALPSLPVKGGAVCVVECGIRKFQAAFREMLIANLLSACLKLIEEAFF